MLEAATASPRAFCTSLESHEALSKPRPPNSIHKVLFDGLEEFQPPNWINGMQAPVLSSTVVLGHGTLSFFKRVISSWVRLKLNTSKDDLSCDSLLLANIVTIPCCTSHRSAISAVDLLWAAATAMTSGSCRTSGLGHPNGVYAEYVMPRSWHCLSVSGSLPSTFRSL